MRLFEASEAREKSYNHRNFDQECEMVFKNIKDYCELGRYSGMMTVKYVHLPKLLEVLERFGYGVQTMPKVHEETRTIKIYWENK